MQPRAAESTTSRGVFRFARSRVDLTAGNGGYILYPPFSMERDTSPATKGDLTAAVESLRSEIIGRFDEDRRHVEVLFEHLKHDVLGAIRYFTSMQQDKQKNHEQRIQRLEQLAGVAVS